MRAALAVLRSSAPWVFASFVCGACAPPAQGPLVGASDAWAKAPDAIPAPKPNADVWDTYTNVREWPPMNAQPFLSLGHPPAGAVDIRVSPEIRATYLALVTDSLFPDGCVLTELSHGQGPGYAMRKVGGAWTYFELDPRGGVLASGALPLCAGCHAQASADSVFGLPRAPK